MIFLNPEGEENMCIRFGYGPQTIFYHTQRQVSRSINSDTINKDKNSTIKMVQSKLKLKSKRPQGKTKNVNRCPKKPSKISLAL